MSKKIHSYVASDYAGIEIPSKGVKFYYGYEVTANDKEEKGDGDWCFEATFGAGKITIPFPVLRLADKSCEQFNVTACLLTGIAILIERGDLSL